jgi:hypothetical protein
VKPSSGFLSSKLLQLLHLCRINIPLINILRHINANIYEASSVLSLIAEEDLKEVTLEVSTGITLAHLTLGLKAFVLSSSLLRFHSVERN